MKKILIIAAFTAFVFHGKTQEGPDQNRKIQGGLTLSTGFNTMSTQTNLIESRGAGFDFSIGVLGDYNLNNNIAITSGIEFSTFRFGYNLNENFQSMGPVFVNYLDKEILRKNNADNIDGMFRVDERINRTMYLTIPTLIKFQTNYLGYMRFFTRFGLWNSILIRNRVDFTGAEVVNIGELKEGELLDMRSPRDLSLYRGSVGITVGGEWNFAGSTSLVAELGYHFGFTDVHRSGSLFGDDDRNFSMYQFEDAGFNDKLYRSASSTPSQFSLRITVIF